MSAQLRKKQELVVEAVRRGLDGDTAVEFIRTSGFATTSAAVSRNLRAMGGRGKIASLLAQGCSNEQVLQQCLPQEEELQQENQPELFEIPEPPRITPLRRPRVVAFETTKLTLTLPSELYQALRLAAHAERKSRNELVIQLLEEALSRMPRHSDEDETETEDGERLV